MMVFDEKAAGTYDEWLETPQGSYMDGREKALIARLVAPKEGDRVLDVGCGTGNHLLFFRDLGCHVTGIEPSAAMLEIAGQKLKDKADLHAGKAEDLPFSDNEFDIVTLVTSLEFMKDPERALNEAIRVSRDRVLLGVLNKYSFIGVRRKIGGVLGNTLYRHARFFSVQELHSMVRARMGSVDISWGSVVFFPSTFYCRAAGLEERIPVLKNPFGAFIGMSFPVSYRYRTVQDVIKDPFGMRVKGGREVQSAVREISKEAEKIVT
jgi:ubiquinone/menaquinone biosynthesis C-methylase UbiE